MAGVPHKHRLAVKLDIIQLFILWVVVRVSNTSLAQLHSAMKGNELNGKFWFQAREEREKAGPSVGGQANYRKQTRVTSREELVEQIRQRKAVNELLSNSKTSQCTSSRMEGLPDIGSTPTGDPPCVLLIDGYNVVRKHPGLLRLIHANSMESARAGLQQMLETFADSTDARVILVWDAMGFEGFGIDGREDRLEEQGSLWILWSGLAEADSLILRMLSKSQLDGAPQVVIVSEDREIAVVARNEGAYVLDGTTLLDDLTSHRRSLLKQRRIELDVQWVTQQQAMRAAFSMSSGLVSKAQARKEGFRSVEHYRSALQQGLNAEGFYAREEAVRLSEERRRKRLDSQSNLARERLAEGLLPEGFAGPGCPPLSHQEQDLPQECADVVCHSRTSGEVADDDGLCREEKGSLHLAVHELDGPSGYGHSDGANSCHSGAYFRCAESVVVDVRHKLEGGELQAPGGGGVRQGVLGAAGGRGHDRCAAVESNSNAGGDFVGSSTSPAQELATVAQCTEGDEISLNGLVRAGPLTVEELASALLQAQHSRKAKS
jgi:predicted RNA-binding protein with PIN domain